MAYCTLQQLTDRFGVDLLIRLTDRVAVPTDAIDPVVVARAQDDADAVINEHIALRYALPVAGAPASLADMAMKITIYNLHVTEPEAKIAKDYEDTMKRLRAVAVGTIILTDVAGAEPPAKDGTGVVMTDRERPFSPENMTGFI
jgi:phage gp36-like protein